MEAATGWGTGARLVAVGRVAQEPSAGPVAVEVVRGQAVHAVPRAWEVEAAGVVVGGGGK